MKHIFFHSVRWLALLGAKFLQVHPLGTVFSVLIALPGQIALIASFLLPIKIIMLMASEGMPHFIPGISADIDKKVLISLLAGLSIGSFIFYHLATRAIEGIAKSGASRIENRNQKLQLFEGQEELTRNSYTRYIDTVASFSFVILGTALLFIIYPEVAFAFITYTVTCIVGALIVQKVTSSDAEDFAQAVQKNLPTLSNIGFLAIFSWVLIDYVFFSIPNSFIFLLVSVILGRQLFSRTAAITNSIFFFTRQKQKLKALLFHREVFQPTPKKRNSIWDFLDSTSISYLQLQETLRSLFEADDEDAELSWQDSGMPGVNILTARMRASSRTFLVKIFEKKKSSEARHEATLLLDAPSMLPCPPLKTDQIISGLYVHILDITDHSFPLEPVEQWQKDELALSATHVAIPEALISRYIRSHRMLWDQLDESDLQQLQFISKDKAVVKTFLSKLPQVRDELKRLPVCLHSSQWGNTNLYCQDSAGNIKFLHWGKWALEPFGTGLSRQSMKELSPNVLEKIFNTHRNVQTSKEPRPDPAVAFLAQQLHKQINKQMFMKSLRTMEELSKYFV
ncbi:hypothetical protein [uncultured Marinobacter sp.]|uniref:hypothetical protein n=1 Tax=uncultured Marinobacter sp. TaxID=187379 RepID=UPI002637A20E|nr:hypothetical protein [uncultured Marinobacter sp.]